ncbi:S9 family peptidase [Agrococcus jejuensis]|uniref:S9 family peptidase n=1 Tax=Agrococcus jejuensis TaxID=399736 RepID=UPI0011AA61EF|nr:prolyl oligopeptidase family serine peptidase [Agrococcus jejuensis]
MTASTDAAPSLLERYRRAAALAPERLPTLMRNRRIDPIWTGDGDAFWYRRQTADGDELVLVDPVAGTRTVGATLADLGVQEPASAAPPAGVLPGPDGRGLRRRDHDLSLVDGDVETPLTADGEEGFAWGALRSDSNMVVPFRRMGLDLPPVGTVHSPSGRRVLTMRVDERRMRTKHMVESVAPGGGARPECHQWRVQLEDEGPPPPPQCRILDLDAGGAVEVDVADGLGAQVIVNGATEVTWSADERYLYLLHHRQGEARAAIVEVDVASGARRDAVVLDEGPLYEPNQFLYHLPLVRVLPETGEVLLFSQRDGWGHLYLFDLATGACLHRVTEGDLVVRDLLRVDVEHREVTFVAGSGDDGWNPSWRRIYRAGLDGGTQRLLTPEPADHDLAAPPPQFFHLVFGKGKPPIDALSPSGRFLVDHISTVDEPPVIVLRDAADAGRIVLELERTDVTALLDAGYVAPHPFRVLADDGETDLWGVVAMPQHPHDPQRIPIVEDVYAGFQIAHAPHAYLGGSGTSARHGALAGYAALGFAAIMVDGRGTPGRDRAFRQWTHRQFHTDRGLEDHVTALAALAAADPRLDTTRVGVVGHSYGGYNAARMLLRFPTAYRAGISSAGVHDPAKMPFGRWDWHLGGSADVDRDGDAYRELGNLHLAERLEGDLLIVCGEIDENATVDHSHALARALMQAGKRFDMRIWPGADHYRIDAYARMTFWDHLVRSLLEQSPPRAFVPG